MKQNSIAMVESDTEMKQRHLTLIICKDIWFVLPNPPDGDIWLVQGPSHYSLSKQTIIDVFMRLFKFHYHSDPWMGRGVPCLLKYTQRPLFNQQTQRPLFVQQTQRPLFVHGKQRPLFAHLVILSLSIRKPGVITFDFLFVKTIIIWISICLMLENFLNFKLGWRHDLKCARLRGTQWRNKILMHCSTLVELGEFLIGKWNRNCCIFIFTKMRKCLRF